jgi:heavy metal sensor kinase
MMRISRLGRHVPIRVRVAALIAVALFVLLGAVTAFQYVQTGNAMRERIDRQLYQAVTSLRLPLIEQQGRNDGGAGEHLELLEARGGMQLIDRSGSVLAAAGELADADRVITLGEVKEVRAGRQILATVDNPDEGTELRVLAVVLDIDEPPQIELESAANEPQDLVAVVGASLAPVRDAQRALLAVYAPSALLASVIAGLLGLAIAGRALAPIARLTRDADEYKETDLERRLFEPERLDEVGRLARTLNDLLARLAAALERERAFTSDASHELRTPLAILRAELELVRQNVEQPDANAALVSALAECDRLSLLVEDLLLLARAEGDVLRTHPVDLGEVARSVVERFTAIADSKGIDLRSTGDAVVEGDERALERAASNLVDNALRHTDAGGRVSVSVEQRDGFVSLGVRDTGEGVPPEHLERLFERFYRPDGARREGGAGLGLAIVASVAERHRGRVTAENCSGGGLLIQLDLPATRDLAAR